MESPTWWLLGLAQTGLEKMHWVAAGTPRAAACAWRTTKTGALSLASLQECVSRHSGGVAEPEVTC